GGFVDITNSTISHNSADLGGGIYDTQYSYDPSILTLVSSTVSGNSAARGGGGIYNDACAIVIVNSTISGNLAGGDGGGIYETGLGVSVTLTNSTITNNRAHADAQIYDGRGGGIFLPRALVLNNSIIAGNFVGMDTTPSDIYNTIFTATGSNNLIG